MSPPPLPTTPTPLFGGALTAAIPTVFQDASTIRPTPSAQEVFIPHPDRTPSKLSVSLLFDILQRVETDPPDDDVRACTEHFEDIVDSGWGDTVGWIREIRGVEPPGGCVFGGVGGGEGGGTKAYLLTGTVGQMVKEEEVGGAIPPAPLAHPFTAIQMLILRLPLQFATDLVVTVNCPLVASEAAVETRVWHPSFKGEPPRVVVEEARRAEVLGGLGLGEFTGGQGSWGFAEAVMETVRSGLGICDWGLFCPEEGEGEEEEE